MATSSYLCMNLSCPARLSADPPLRVPDSRPDLADPIRFALDALIPGVPDLDPPAVERDVLKAAPDFVGSIAGHFEKREFTFEFDPADLPGANAGMVTHQAHDGAFVDFIQAADVDEKTLGTRRVRVDRGGHWRAGRRTTDEPQH